MYATACRPVHAGEKASERGVRSGLDQDQSRSMLAT